MDNWIMKKLLMTLALLTLSFHSHAQEIDSVTVEIEAAYQKYFSDFISRDNSAIASNFQVPAMLGVRSQSYMIAKTVAEVEEFFKNAPIQEGYAYSTLESIEVQQLKPNVYSVDTEFSRIGQIGDILFRGKATYLYSNDTGEWKIFASMGALESN